MGLLACWLSLPLFAQPPVLRVEPVNYVAIDAPLVALKDVRVIDGSGAPARPDRTLIIQAGRIKAEGAAADLAIPEGAKVLELKGKTVLPGWVMMHEHLFYPTGDEQYVTQTYSFPKLYLAGGVTTMRTTGSIEPYAELNLKKAIEAGLVPGPDMDVTGPYLEGHGLSLLQVKELESPEEAARMVRYWTTEGVTSYKVYMHITRAALAAVVKEAHGQGLKVTGHLCSVTFREAVDLGIDNLEHGFIVATDFIPTKKPDECPTMEEVVASLTALDIDSKQVHALIEFLVEHEVAITSTLTVYETLVPGRPALPDEILELMLPEVRDQYLRTWARISVSGDPAWRTILEKEMALERAFVAAGGLLLVGTDPTGYGGVVPGYANHRAVALLVEAGFSNLEAITIATRNGARYLGRETDIGTIATGKRADLTIVEGNPAEDIDQIQKVTLVFKAGIGYDPAKLIAAARGKVGLH